MQTHVSIVDNVFVRMFALPRIGDVHDGHAHVFDHITLLAKGTVKMRTSKSHDMSESTERHYMAPELIVTPKGIVHEFEAMTDDCLLFCIHAIRDGDGLDDIAPQEITKEQAAELITKYPLIQIDASAVR